MHIQGRKVTKTQSLSSVDFKEHHYDKEHSISRNRRRIRQHRSLFDLMSFYIFINHQRISYSISQYPRFFHHRSIDSSITKRHVSPYGDRILRRFHHILHLLGASFTNDAKRTTSIFHYLHLYICHCFNSICLLRLLLIRKIH